MNDLVEVVSTKTSLLAFIHHAYEKLLRLVSDGFIVTEAGKDLATLRHNILASFVATILPVYPELRETYPPPPFL